MAFTPLKQTSTATLTAELLTNLRLYGVEYVLSNEDKSKVKPSNYSQEYMANKLGMTKAAYSKIENGDVVVNILQISRVCKIFQVSLNKCLAYIDNKIEKLTNEGIEVVDERLPLKHDFIRWNNKLNEKTEANFNKCIRKLKKEKTYSLLTSTDLEELKKQAQIDALNYLEERH